MRELGAINNAAYRHINGADTLNASAHLRRLRALSLLAMKGSGSQTYYVAGEAFKRAASPSTSTGRLGADTPQAIGQIHTSPPANTHQVPPNTHQVGPNTPQVTIQTAAQTLPEALRGRLPIPGTKPRRKAIQQLLIDLCAWKPLSARELAMLLGREDPKHLVRELLSPMVADGLLAYTIPAMEKHPEQRYVAPRAPKWATVRSGRQTSSQSEPSSRHQWVEAARAGQGELDMQLDGLRGWANTLCHGG